MFAAVRLGLRPAFRAAFRPPPAFHQQRLGTFVTFARSRIRAASLARPLFKPFEAKPPGLSLPFSKFRRAFHQSRRNQQSYRYQRFQNSTGVFLLRRWAQRPTFYYEVGGIGGLLGLFYMSNLKTVPGSGRRQFRVVSEEFEKQMGAQMYKQTLQQYRGAVLPPHDPRVQRVERVLERLIPHSGVADSDWEVNVIDDPDTPNAFVIPGGKVFVFTGILPIAQDDDGLATVLGHEIAHNVAHHSGEQMSRGFLLIGVIWVASLLFGIDTQASNILLSLGFERPGSRRQESEADYLGLLMMAASCYNPDSAVTFWNRMQQQEKSHGGAPPQFLSTHPSSHNRQEQLRSWLPEAHDRLNSSECGPVTRYSEKFWNTVGQRRDGAW